MFAPCLWTGSSCDLFFPRLSPSEFAELDRQQKSMQLHKQARNVLLKVVQFCSSIVRLMWAGATDQGKATTFDKVWLTRFIQRNTVLIVEELGGDGDLERGDVTLKITYKRIPWWQHLISQKSRRGKLCVLRITLSCEDASGLIVSLWRSSPGVDVRVATKTTLRLKPGAPDDAGELTCSICRESLDGAGLLTIATLPCVHAFRAACVKRWAQSGSASCRACPLCRCPY